MADDVELSLDPSGYVAGVNTLDQANQRLQRSFAGVTTSSTITQRALNAITPGRAAMAGMILFAQQAAQSEQNLSGLAATSVVTNVNVSKLAGGIRQMARDMPLGSTQSRQMVEQITRMGVAGAGSEGKILKLATSVSKLSGATGDGPQQLAQGMVELSRATGNSNLDPKRFSALGDSLTTVSAQSGASASNILAFSKSIAPMAQASGIGATGVLGISSAFAKLGEDGIGASTAVNKMLTDMNRSVREGSPEIKSYAAIVGKSANEFERLFKSNPAEAITQVTEAVAKAGSNGPRLLEQLGIEGVRGQRSIQALVSSGGLRESINTAVSAYGNGSTEEASKAAFGGLNDSLSELSEATQQVAEAFGRPLLGPLTSFVNLIKAGTTGIGNVANSGVGQGALSALTYGGIGLLGARAVMGPLGALALGRQALTSTPLRAMAAGFANATGRTDGFFTRYGAGAQRAYDDGTMGRYSRAAYDRAFGFTQQYQALNPPTGQPGIFQRAYRGARAWGGNLANTYMQSVAQQYTNATAQPFVQAREGRSWRTGFRPGALRFDAEGQPIMQRRDAFVPAQGFSQAWQAAQRVDTAGMSQWQVLRTSLSAFNKELTQGAGASLTWRQQLGAFGSMAASQTRVLGALGGDLRRGAMGAAGKLGGILGPGMLIGGGIAAGSYLYSRYQEQQDANKQLGGNDIAGTLNEYRESIGKATDTTKTFAQLNAQFNTQLAKRASAGTFDQAKTITEDDLSAAAGTRDKRTRTYFGSDAQVAGQIASFSPGGLAPDEMQAIKVDLLRQFSQGQVASILGQLPGTADASKNPTGGSLTPKTLKDAVEGISSAGYTGLGGVMAAGGGEAQFDDFTGFGPNLTGPGRIGYVNPLSDDQMKAIQGIAEGIGQQTSTQSEKFGSNYAQQETAKSMNAALKAAYDKGDTAQFYELSKRFGIQLGGQDQANTIWNAREFREGGFDFTKMVADRSDSYRGTRNAMLGAGGTTDPNGKSSIAPTLAQSIYYDTVKPESAFLASAFDARSGNAMTKAMTASLSQPGNVKLQEQATNAVVEGAQAAGKSMSDLALEASKSAAAVADNTDQYARLKAVQARAEQQMAYQQANMAPGQAQIQQYQYAYAKANTTPTTDAQRQEVEQAKQQVVQLEDAMRQRLVARLQMQRQYEIAVGRANEDFGRQQLYAEQDYETQVSRTQRNFRLQREQADHQFKIGQQRAEEDYQKSRTRTIRDANISIARAEQDFQTSRARQVRDFNKTLKRQIEDAASTMYDPYSRIQAKPTWDAANLGVNLQEQTAAMEKQKSQLEALRKAGLSTTAIDQLGLGKAENAQQVDQLSTMSAAQIAQLNKDVQARAKAAGALYTDDSNKELKRQREDLNTAFKDQEADFQKSLKRQREDLNRSLSDSAKDFSKNQARQNEDFAYSLSMAKRQLSITLGDMAADRDRAVTRATDGLHTSLKRMKEDIRNSDQAIAGSMSDLAEATNRAIHGKAVKWQKILKDDTASWVTDMQRTVIPKVGTVFSAFGVTPGAGATASPASGNRNVGVSGKNQALDSRPWGTGGPVAGHSMHEKADDIPARLTAGEFVHNVLAVRHYGTELMQAINNRSIPKEQLIKARGYADGGWVNPVAPTRPGFPWGRYPSGGRHPALDYPVRVGTPVHSPWTGRIDTAGWSNTGFGNHVRMISGGGIGTILGHMSALLVKAGQQVAQRQLLGFSGSTGNSTGPHLHLEMRRSLWNPATAFDFTKMAGADFNAIMAANVPTQDKAAAIARLFAGMKDKPGPYNQLTATAKKAVAGILYDQGGVIPHGGVGVNLSGRPERVLTDVQWNALAGLASKGGMSLDTARDIRAAAGAQITINNSGSVTYDQRNDFGNANIQVVSNDPDDMARKLQAKAVRQRVTQTRGVRRGS